MTNIYKIAYGSLLTTPGDSVLYYTGDISSRARGINGIFVDNPPVLDPSHATLIWRYYADSDRYVFMHIQGSHALFPAQGRVYPYRAAFEVTRTDVNALADSAKRFPITALVAAMPRIDEEATETSAKKQPATDVDINTRGKATTEACILADNITCAIYSGQQLHIELPPQASALKNNDIFTAPQLATLLAAIEQLPVGLARYASFAFCADEHHAAVTDDVLIMLYPNEKVPAGVNAHAWENLISNGPHYGSKGEKETQFFELVAKHLPGKDKPLLKRDDMMKAFRENIATYSRLENAGCAKLKADELEVWLGPLGHKVEELPAKSWYDVRDYCARLKGSKHLAAYIKLHRSEALDWTALGGIDEATVKAFKLNPDEYKALRQKAFEDYWKGTADGQKLAFLFADDKGKTFIAESLRKKPELLQKKVGNGFQKLVKLVTELSYIDVPTWEKAFKDKTFTQTEGYGPESYDENLAPEKKEFLEKVRKASLSGSAPSSWTDLSGCLKKAIGEPADAENAALRFKKFTADNCRAAVGEGKDRLQHLQQLASFARQLSGCKSYKKHTELRNAHAFIVQIVAEHCQAAMEKAMFTKDGSMRQKSFAVEFCKAMNDANLLANEDIEEGDKSGKHYRTFFVRHFTTWEKGSLKTLVEYLPKLKKSIETARKKEDTNGLEAAEKLLKDIWKFVAAMPEGKGLKAVKDKDKPAKGKPTQGKAAKGQPQHKANNEKSGFLDTIKNLFKGLISKKDEETMSNEIDDEDVENANDTAAENPAGIEIVNKTTTKAPVAETPETEAPVADTPETEAPVADTPETEAPVADTPENEESAAEAPKAKGKSATSKTAAQACPNGPLKLKEFKADSSTYKLARTVTCKKWTIDGTVIIIVVLALILAGVLAFFLLRDATPNDGDEFPSDPGSTELVNPGGDSTSPGTGSDTLFGTTNATDNATNSANNATNSVNNAITPTPGLDANANIGEPQP